MRRENGIYLLAFLCGVVAVNIFGNTTWVNNSTLNRYTLVTLSFRGIVYEEYFFHVLLLRLRTVLGLWLIAKIIPKKMVVICFATVICGALGGVITIAILSNGLWGILFCLCAFFPHIICYGLAYVLWGNMRGTYAGEKNKKSEYVATVLIGMLIVIGCILEAYISPILMENLIKY